MDLCHLLGNIFCISFIVILFINILSWIYVNIVGPQCLGPKIDVHSIGEWAVVTGATDGIGKAYAKSLAKMGMKIVLISRSSTKLQNVAKEIENEASVELKLITIDFTGDENIYKKIKNEIQLLDVGVLVNNVGISYEHPEYFIDAVNKNPNFVHDIIQANIHSVVNMCAIVLPHMVAKKKGVIINLSSTAACIPNPLLSIYSATKAFVDKFSADLQIEYRSQGIFVQSVQPGFVATNMTKIRHASTFAPTADTFVASSLSTIGYASQTTGYLPHTLLQFGIHAFSIIVCKPFVENLIFKNLLSMRKRALRNLSKK